MMRVGDIVVTPLGYEAKITSFHGPYVDVKYLPDSGSAVRINTFKKEQLVIK